MAQGHTRTSARAQQPDGQNSLHTVRLKPAGHVRKRKREAKQQPKPPRKGHEDQQDQQEEQGTKGDQGLAHPSHSGHRHSSRVQRAGGRIDYSALAKQGDVAIIDEPAVAQSSGSAAPAAPVAKSGARSASTGAAQKRKRQEADNAEKRPRISDPGAAAAEVRKTAQLRS